ncbi:MAG: NAD(P)(+) transhydrogenase (Re/Si-specific) subunit alpha, partial [Proteobacteria bacterium]|nr:NAD(P)(+) transhydrogenase (Re/Si-specific) subunit alpha [Pseudomonadota bacterium]
MLIGIPKEIMHKENRVAALPETVAKFKALGFNVIIETTAGTGAFTDDEAYLKAGAVIAKDAVEVFDKADIILKVKEPMFNKQFDKHEIDMLKENQM